MYELNKSSQWLPNTPFASISECLVSKLCLGYEHDEGHRDPILVKHELNMLRNLLSVSTNFQVDTTKHLEKSS